MRKSGEDTLRHLTWVLEEALSYSPHNKKFRCFFEREIRFELLKSTRGSQYPTPHHLATLMALLAIPEGFADVFDLTAGSGGLLAAAYELNRPLNSVQVTGMDYDPAWSALGTVNLLLHDQRGDASFALGSAIDFSDSQRVAFNSVLMNSPFSGSRAKWEVWNALHTEEFGTANANVLSAKSLQLLQPGGRAALLLPSGVLSGGGANARLRALFIRNHLEAIITLDNECFQPFSHVSAHLVVLQKLADNAPPPSASIWLGTVVRDGYPTGAGRDLTADPAPNVNELPRVRELVLQGRQTTWPHRLALADSYTG